MNKIKGFIEVEFSKYINKDFHREVIKRTILFNVNNITIIEEEKENDYFKTRIETTDGCEYKTDESYQSVVDKIKASQFM